MTTLAPEKEALEAPTDDSDFDHITCHCTNDRISFCRIDISHLPMSDGLDEEDSPENLCPMCALEMETNITACPFGCTCDECKQL